MQGSILRCVKLLGDDSRRGGLHVHRVQGAPGVWEAYVDRANRVTFHWSEGRIVLRKNCNHDILRRP